MTQSLTETRSAWSGIADGYDTYVTPSHLSLGAQAVKLAGVARGESFLDIAAGSGALSIPAARRGAEVLATDVSPVMLERLAERAADEGLHSVRTQVMDGHDLELEDGTFDVAGSQFGVMLFPDLPKALREIHRVLKPGGRTVIAAFGPPADVEFLSFFFGAVKTVVPDFPGLPSDPPPYEFQIADPALFAARLKEAGLKDVRIERVTEVLSVESVDALWAWLGSSNPIGKHLVEGLPHEQRAMTREVLAGMLRERAGEDGVAELVIPINIGLGTK